MSTHRRYRHAHISTIAPQTAWQVGVKFSLDRARAYIKRKRDFICRIDRSRYLLPTLCQVRDLSFMIKGLPEYEQIAQSRLTICSVRPIIKPGA